MKFYAASNIGKVRELNEDSYYLPENGELFCAVADGMGGHNAGEVASALAVDVFADYMRSAKELNALSMRKAVERANRRVFHSAAENAERSGMGTTFTALCRTNGGVSIAHVGDSRAYLIRRRSILQLTRDHTLVEELVESGAITAQEARNHPRRNYITRALGTEPSVEVDVMNGGVAADDVFLLCSDGLSGLVEDREMLSAVREGKAPEATIQKLVDLALSRGGRDNITCVLAYVNGEDA